MPTWTVPKTFVANSALPAGDLNTYLGDPIKWLKTLAMVATIMNAGADFTTASVSFVDVTGVAVTITKATATSTIIVLATLSHKGSGAADIHYFNMYDSVAAADQVANDGLAVDTPGTSGRATTLVFVLTGLAAGAHTLTLRMKVSAGTATVWLGAGTGGADVHPNIVAFELGT